MVSSVVVQPDGLIDRWEPVRQLFYHLAARGSFLGGQLVVRWRGEVVVDEAVGWTRPRHGAPVTPTTPFLTFSITKSLTSICVHHLVERGLLDLDKPVADYWPAFGQKGKGRVTVRQVMLHQAGIPGRWYALLVPLWLNWRGGTWYVARQRPTVRPGQSSAYHAFTTGFVLGELVRRVSGLSVKGYIKKHFWEPLGFEHTYFGLPRGLWGRAAELQRHPGGHWPAWRLFRARMMRTKLFPAANVHSTARELAIFFEMLVQKGEYGGRRLLAAETVERATRLEYAGQDVILKRDVHWSPGFEIGGAKYIDGYRMGASGGRTTFGHFGFDTCMAWGDFAKEVVIAFNCNTLLSSRASEKRVQALSEAVWAAVE
ncbi:MAG TPA: serine hydrolase domain-containing protein [Anaerolineae bacterium]|nr:serine hydrolase domain-containing protein [Anaerolineae bacterium]